MSTWLEHIAYSVQNIPGELLLFFLILFQVVWIAFSNKEKSLLLVGITILVLLLATWIFFNRETGISLFGQLLMVDPHAGKFQALSCLILIFCLLHWHFAEESGPAEYLIMLSSATLAACLLLLSRHFLGMYVLLELLSLSSYVLVVIQKGKLQYEASIKYLVVGATISAIMLFGISLLYGFGYGLSFDALAHILQAGDTAAAILLFLLASGMLFKLSVLPFHIWAPDVYEATPSALLTFLSTVPKIAAFLVLEKLVWAVGLPFPTLWSVLILASVSLGNLAAIWQQDFKRLMAYSGIAQSGFILFGLVYLSEQGISAYHFYIFIYVLMNAGAFVLLDILKQITGSTRIEDFKGLGQKHLGFGVLVTLILISLVGIPPTAGFLAKFGVFASLLPHIDSGFSIAAMLLFFGVINTVISMFFYLKVPYFFFLKHVNSTSGTYSTALLMLLMLCAFALVVFFFSPFTI